VRRVVLMGTHSSCVAACALAIKNKNKKQKQKENTFCFFFYMQKIEDAPTPFTKSLPPK
jgi:hypothetical protein